MQRNTTHTDETKQKISSSMKGKVVSNETKLKMSESKKAYWAKRKQALDSLKVQDQNN